MATGEWVYMTYEHQLWLYNQGVRSRPSFKEDDPGTLDIIKKSLQFKTIEEIKELKKSEKKELDSGEERKNCKTQRTQNSQSLGGLKF